MTEETIFAAALEKTGPAERAAYLDAACAGDPSLRRRVEALLASHADPAFLGNPAVQRPSPPEAPGPANAADAPTATWPGSRSESGTVLAERYKLLEMIGEGGMGSVWMAEQMEPVKRRVAIKLIKPGMDSKAVLARFEAERQALALMDHPNIAKVLDGGATPDGRPFFVMELVKGTPLTEYCDDKRLAVRERLALFADVCRAVQHAHQKGVIHRDLKPSNVLVAPYDGKPVVKVIDFGVAKAAGPQLTEKTLFTGFGAVVGTPEYMSPEQAEVNNADIDTRSDIYSLGVLLYELLTGTTPLTKQRVKEAALLEVLRVIREEESPRPSTRLSTTEELPSIAAVRGVEPAKLSKLVRGELDWIVMKALEKDRNRRYETATGLAADVDRYLAGEAVQAYPPSAAYRLRKFARRNKGPVLAATLVLLVLAAGIVGTTWGMFRATEAEADAKREAGEKTVALGEKETALATAKAAQKEAQENLKDAVAAVDQMLIRVGNDRLRYVPQMEAIRRDLLQDAVNFYKRFLEKNGDDPTIRKETALAYRRLADLHRILGPIAEAELAYRKAFALFEKLEAQAPLELKTRDDLVSAHLEFAVTLRAMGKREEEKQHVRRAVRIAEQLFSEAPQDRHGDTLANANLHLAEYLAPDEKEKLVRRNLTLAKDPLFLAHTQRELSGIFAATGRHREAEEAAIQAVKLMEEVVAREPSANWAHVYLGTALSELAGRVAANGRLEAAVEIYGRAVPILDKLAADFPKIREYRVEQPWCHHRLAGALKKLNRTAEAEQSYRRALELFEQLAVDFPSRPDFRQWAFDHRLNLVRFLTEAGKTNEASRVYHEAVSIISKLPTDDRGRFTHWTALARTQIELGHLLAAAGKQPEAQAAFGEALAIRDRLEKEFADKPGFRRDLAASHDAIGHALKEAHHLDEAIKTFRMALSPREKLAAEFPHDTGYFNELAQAHVHLAFLLPRPQAEQEFRTVVGIYEKLVAETHGEHARYLEQLGHYRRFLAGTVGNTKEAERLIREALSDFEKLTAAHPDVAVYWHFQADSHRLIGRLLVLRKQLPEAEKAYRRSIDIHEHRIAGFPGQSISQDDPEATRLRDVAAAYSELHDLLAATGRAQEGETFHKGAIAAWRKVIELDPKSQFAAGAYFSLGKAMEEQGKLDETIDCFRKAAELDPNFALAYSCLAWLLTTCREAKLRDAPGGLQAARKAVRVAPQSSLAWQVLGWAHYRTGDWKASIEALEKSCVLDSPKGGGPWQWFFLAMAHWRLGEKDKAGQWYDQAVKWTDKNKPGDEILRRFRAEAADLLELKEKK